MIALTLNNDHIAVSLDGIYLGFIRLSDNPYHKRNRYIDLHLKTLDPAIGAELFEKAAQILGRSLQAMTRSNDTRIIDFLTAGGFVCARKCFEVTAYEGDFIGKTGKTALLHAKKGEAEYDLCSGIMYERYIKTHMAINPWTAELTDFCDLLPGEVVYEAHNGRIENLAFVEENEIAYVYGADEEGFDPFAASLIGLLFSKYDSISFECDNCDSIAMRLRSMFISQSEESFDTYIYEK